VGLGVDLGDFEEEEEEDVEEEEEEEDVKEEEDVDEKDEGEHVVVTGQVIGHDDCIQRGVWRVCVCVFVLNGRYPAAP
jgi:protocatechuate 3,4-dioxygenase beta subunit